MFYIFILFYCSAAVCQSVVTKRIRYAMLWKVGLRSVTESRSRVCRGSDTSDRDLSDGRLLCLPRADALPRGSKYQSAQCLSHSGAALYVRVYVRVSVRPSVCRSLAASVKPATSVPRPSTAWESSIYQLSRRRRHHSSGLRYSCRCSRPLELGSENDGATRFELKWT